MEKEDYPVHRKSRRRLICIPILISAEEKGGYTLDYTTDLSEGGVLIQTEDPFPQGTKLNLKFRLPNAIKLIEAKGEVMWSRKFSLDDKGLDLMPGMGVRFIEIDDKSRVYLEEFVKSVRGKPIFEDESLIE